MAERVQFDWRGLKGVIFDVDGTLYDSKRMRRFMLLDLLRYFLARPQRCSELRTLYEFRRQREKNRSLLVSHLEREQYLWPAEKLGAAEEEVRRTVQKWIFDEPLRHLAVCRYRGVEEVFGALRLRKVGIAVVSDYPAEQKLEALGVRADLALCSTDSRINRFKPDPTGLLLAAAMLGLKPNQVLAIGDRTECDALAAERAGMPYRLVGKNPELFYTGLLTEVEML
jgi:phosphoglycolate phosphatase/putative hydrolase of the HAD superfamily